MPKQLSLSVAESLNGATSFSIFAALAAIVAALSFRFFFPGYFDPFAIYHSDHYIYMGLSARHWPLSRYATEYPRPVAHLIIDFCGRLGPRGLLVPIFLLSIFNAALLALYIERVTGRKIARWCFVLFAALAFANPQLYWNLKDDPFATFALTFLLLVLHFWQIYIETGKIVFLAAVPLFIVLFALTKESYFGLLALFFVVQLLIAPKQRMAAAILLVFSLSAMSYSIHRSAQLWTLFNPQAHESDPYYSTLAPSAVAHGLLRLGTYVFFPVLDLAIVALLIVLWRRSRALFLIALASLIFAIVSLVPNATLPNHLQTQYAGLAIYFFLAPFLLLDRVGPGNPRARTGLLLCVLAVYGSALWEYRRSVRSSDAWWHRIQEQQARHTVSALAQMRNTLKPYETSLVTGIDTPFNPFTTTSSFILGYMGPKRFWTVIVPADVAESADDTTRLIHANNPVRLQTPDRWFVFNANGTIAKELQHPSPATIAPELSAAELQTQTTVASRLPGFGQISFYAVPNPIEFGPDGTAVATIFWSAPVLAVQVRVGAPGGTLFTQGESVGEAKTADWVQPGMLFYLQDASSGDPASPDHTLRTLEITQRAH